MSSLPINNFKPVHKEMPTAKQMDDKLKEVSTLYEKQFLRMMLKEMRQTVKPSGLNQPSMTENIFQEKLDSEYVEKWGDTGGIGLSDIIYSQLKERFAPQLQQMQKPQGPLPLDKGSSFKIDNSVDETEKFHPVNEEKDMSMQLNAKPGGAETRLVTSPWGGVVKKAIRSDQGQTHIQIEHDNFLQSSINYQGRLDSLKVGDRIDAGQTVGAVSADTGQLNWKLVEVET